MFQQMAKDCGKQEGASDDDINGMLALKPTNTRASKCVQACLAEGPGIVSQFSFSKWHGINCNV